MDPILVDQRFMPVLYVRYVRAATDDEFDAYLAKIQTTLYAPDAPMRAVLIDATEAAPPTARQRRRQAEWQKTHYERLRDRTTGIAFVTSSPMIRGVVTAIFWLQTLPCPHQVFGDLREAALWCRDRLTERGVVVAADLVASLSGASRVKP